MDPWLLALVDVPRASWDTGRRFWSVADRAAESDRHLGLGSTTVDVRDRWTVLRSPDGQVYCLTDRDPATGRVLTGRSSA